MSHANRFLTPSAIYYLCLNLNERGIKLSTLNFDSDLARFAIIFQAFYVVCSTGGRNKELVPRLEKKIKLWKLWQQHIHALCFTNNYYFFEKKFIRPQEYKPIGIQFFAFY